LLPSRPPLLPILPISPTTPIHPIQTAPFTLEGTLPEKPLHLRNFFFLIFDFLFFISPSSPFTRAEPLSPTASIFFFLICVFDF